MKTLPILTIIAGANGSGKTTFAVPYTREIGVQFLNADQLTKRYELEGQSNAMVKGGREFFRLLKEAIAKKEDVAIETTLSGTYTTKVAKQAKSLGYTVKMIYIFLEDAEMCVDRVRIRVNKNGHHVPTEDIKRRFYRSIDNFRNNFMDLSDVWYLYYNGLPTRILVAVSNMGNREIADSDLFNYLLNIDTNDAD